MCYDSNWIPCVSRLTTTNDNSHIDHGQLPDEDLYLYSDIVVSNLLDALNSTMVPFLLGVH